MGAVSAVRRKAFRKNYYGRDLTGGGDVGPPAPTHPASTTLQFIFCCIAIEHKRSKDGRSQQCSRTTAAHDQEDPPQTHVSSPLNDLVRRRLM
jgi:hypothetical protein